MNDFLQMHLTRPYAEGMRKTDGAESGGRAQSSAEGSFLETVQEKLAQAREAQEREQLAQAKEAQEREQPMQEEKAQERERGQERGAESRRAEAKKKEKLYWEKRAKRRKLYMDLAQKAWYRRENEREYQLNLALHRRQISSARLQQAAMERATGEMQKLRVNPSVLSEAATKFAQGYTFFKIPSARMNPRPKTGR